MAKQDKLPAWVREDNPDAEGAGSDWESWDDF